MPQRDKSLAMFVQHMPAAAALLDRSLRYVMVSQRWSADFALGAQRLSGEAHFDYFSEGEQAWRARFEKALKGHVLKGTETPLTRSTGQTYWVNWELRPWYRTDSEIAGVTFFADDQTARKKAEDAQLRSQANLRAILDGSRQGLALIDADYRVVDSNRLAQHYAQVMAGEGAQTGASILKYVPASVRERFRERLDAAMEGQLQQGLWESPEGSWYEVSYTPVFYGLGGTAGLCISFDDVTARKQAEQAMAHYSEILEHRNRDLQEFAYVASHDLQEPLRKVRAFSGLLRDEYSEVVDGEGELYLDRIVDAAGRMSTLINALLAYARISTRTREFVRVDLGEVLADVLSDLELKIGDTQAEVEVGALPDVTADETQMRQLFQNLVGNALKFCRPGEAPRVRVFQRAATGVLPGGTPAAEIVVQDEGIGFEPGQAANIFDPFHRLHGRGDYEGTGMGLAICRRIAERHGGQLSAAAEPGSGATFVLRLPEDVPTPAA